MVFQDYALFPHLDAWRNACFGLRPRQDRARVQRLLDLLGLAGLERRYPHELSGGQRQRLALVRALAPGNGVVLLDEPFSNLDVEVRLRLRSELPAVLAECGAAALLVTHDPEEALAVCDRVAVLHQGRLHQCASPMELVSRPATAFVGRFVLQGNLLRAERRGLATLPVQDWQCQIGRGVRARQAGREVLVGNRRLLREEIPWLQMTAVRSDRNCMWAQFTVFVNRRAEVQANLQAQGIPTAVHYPIPLNRQPAYADLCCPDCCPESVRAGERVMSLPMSADLTDRDLRRVVEALAVACACLNAAAADSPSAPP
jgi:ABC-type sulfate/molybdate transport systems ATPase subunit